MAQWFCIQPFDIRLGREHCDSRNFTPLVSYINNLVGSITELLDLTTESTRAVRLCNQICGEEAIENEGPQSDDAKAKVAALLGKIQPINHIVPQANANLEELRRLGPLQDDISESKRLKMVEFGPEFVQAMEQITTQITSRMEQQFRRLKLAQTHFALLDEDAGSWVEDQLAVGTHSWLMDAWRHLEIVTNVMFQALSDPKNPENPDIPN